MPRFVEIRSYQLHPGTGAAFARLVAEQAIPLLERWQMDVVAYGPSLHDADSFYLIRSFASMTDRQQSEDAFYGSAEWRQGPRAAILALIQTYTEIVLQLESATVDGLRPAVQPES